MAEAQKIRDVKATLEEVAAMLEEMRSHLGTLSEDQARWVPPGEDVWPIQRAVTHCVNCEHRAVTELQRALKGQPTPETIAADTAIFAVARTDTLRAGAAGGRTESPDREPVGNLGLIASGHRSRTLSQASSADACRIRVRHARPYGKASRRHKEEDGRHATNGRMRP